MAVASPKVDRRPWPGGKAGDRLTLTETAQRIRDGMREPLLRGLAGKILKEAGSPTSARGRVEALRSHVRKEFIYAPDPPMTEMVVAAGNSLCLEGFACLPLGDCDDTIVALGSLIGAAGLDVHVLALDYGPGIQPHVILEFQDDDSRWVAADGTPPYPPLGYRPKAKYTTVDPMNPTQVPGNEYPNGAFVGVGASAPSAIPYQSVAIPTSGSAVAHTGLRYRIGMVLTFQSDPTDSYRASVETRFYFEALGWTIESLDPQGPAQSILDTGWVQSWLMQAVATREIPLSQSDAVTYVVVGVQAASATPAAPGAAPIVPVTALPWNASIAGGVVAAVGLGAAIGLSIYLVRRYG